MFENWDGVTSEVDQYLGRRFALRPQLWLRKKIRSFVQEQIQKIGFNDNKPCTTIHVRRGDIATYEDDNRRYRSIAEYLNASVIDPHFQLKDNIFLLTDDSNAIGEAKTLFPRFHWMTIDRPRFKSDEGGWEHQLPSNDPVFEVIVLLSTFRLVQECDSIVITDSSFGRLLAKYMRIRNATAQVIDLDDSKYEKHFFYTENNTMSKKFSRDYSNTVSQIG